MPDPQLVYPVGILSTFPVFFLARAVWPRRQEQTKQTCTNAADVRVLLAVLMLVALSVPFYLAKQSQIIAMIVVGVIFGPVLNPGNPSPMGLRCSPLRTHTRPARGQGALTAWARVAASRRQPASSTWVSCSFSSWAAWR